MASLEVQRTQAALQSHPDKTLGRIYRGLWVNGTWDTAALIIRDAIEREYIDRHGYDAMKVWSGRIEEEVRYDPQA